MDQPQRLRTSRPHIVLFLTDDHAQWASTCYGNGELCTPNLNYLAQSGARMRNAFTPSPVCSPARACLLTGLLPSQHGIHDWLDERGRAADHPGLAGQATLGGLLRAGGYRTGLVGKWHCGRSWEPHPGFDRWFSYWKSQYPHRGDIEFSDQGRRHVAAGYQADIVTEQAVSFVRAPSDRPFLLVVGYVCTHTPHAHQPGRWAARYRECTFGDIPDEAPEPAHGFARFGWPHAPGVRRDELVQYYAAVSHIDDQLGRVIDALDGAGALENTLIAYVSDHGHMNGHHGLHTKGNATIPQNFLDESIRVPCLLSWPGAIPGGQTREETVDHLDLFQTILEAGAVAAPAEAPRAGCSYLPLLRGGEAPWREAQFCEYGNARMIRTSSHKWIERGQGPNGRFPNELYDLSQDGRETVNLAADPACRGTIETLSSRLRENFSRYESPGRSGWDIASQPPCNADEPWSRTPK